ncbi:hypothetical protein PMm318_A44620 [Pseudomonas moorei]
MVFEFGFVEEARKLACASKVSFCGWKAEVELSEQITVEPFEGWLLEIVFFRTANHLRVNEIDMTGANVFIDFFFWVEGCRNEIY